MESPNEPDRTREQGIEFGALIEHLASHAYPTTTEEVLTVYGDFDLQCPNGDQTVREVLEPLQGEQFTSPEDVRQSVFTMVDEKAIGRKAYSDRTPPAPGEEREEPPESI